MYQPLLSLHYLLRGFTLLTHPQLRRFVLIPLLINTLFFSGLIVLSMRLFQHITTWLETWLPAWLVWLEWILWLVFTLGVIGVLIYTFMLVANIIAAPFNGLLAEKVQHIFTNDVLPTRTHFIKIATNSCLRQVHILGYYLIRIIALLILFFIPIIQVIATPLWFSFNAWLLNLQYMDYVMDNNETSFPQMRVQLKQHRWLHLEFGMFVLLLAAIPVVNFLVMPAAVIASTLIWIDFYSPSVKSKIST
ncbi:MAG: sulfate transporter CysZ [Gammaproteobacteria bacterium]